MAKKKDEQTLEDLVQNPDVVIVEDIQMTDSIGEPEKKTENDNIQEILVDYEEDLKANPDKEDIIVEEVAEGSEIIVHEIKVNFPNVGSKVTSIIQATGQTDELIAAGKRLKLIAGRFYYVPVNKMIDSDDFANLKIMSDIADKIDVRFVKGGLACITPLMSGMDLLNDTRLCMIW